MSNVKHTVTFAGIDDETADDRITISLTRKDNVLICLWRKKTVIFNGTIQSADWRAMVETFAQPEAENALA